MMQRSELETRLRRDADRIDFEVPPRVRRAVIEELAREPERSSRLRLLRFSPAGALACTLAVLLVPWRLDEPAVVEAPPRPVATAVEGFSIDEALSTREAALSEEYTRIQRDLERLRALLDQA